MERAGMAAHLSPEMPGPHAREGPKEERVSEMEGVDAGEGARTLDTGIGIIASRYKLTWNAGRPQVLCLNSPNLTLEYHKGRTLSPRALRRLPRGTILLDGAFGGPPFYDNRRRRYSLDHHAGCVRSFTLASCEQAAVVLYQGMPLADGLWNLVINGIDLDSILAAWLLMNHADLVKSDHRLLEAAMPLVRLEGVIDAHGVGAGLLTGLHKDTRARLGGELSRLAELARAAPRLEGAEAGKLIIELLSALDTLLIPEKDLAELQSYEELGRVGLKGGGLGILVRSSLGIYETEEFFKERLGQGLGLLALAQGEGRYTLRLVNRFLAEDLGKLYRLLNRLDPAVRKGKAMADNAWGGSANIGGSPRQSGTALPAADILDAIGRIYGPKRLSLIRLLSLSRHPGGKDPRGPAQ
jgi:hypothetical protein